jgi:hypothetical protein
MFDISHDLFYDLIYIYTLTKQDNHNHDMMQVRVKLCTLLTGMLLS